jgi:hypothetical protein
MLYYFKLYIQRLYVNYNRICPFTIFLELSSPTAAEPASGADGGAAAELATASFSVSPAAAADSVASVALKAVDAGVGRGCRKRALAATAAAALAVDPESGVFSQKSESRRS